MSDKPKNRLYTTQPLEQGALLRVEDAQAHYLLHTLRCREGDTVAVFNGHDGEWLARISSAGKKSLEMQAERRLSTYKSCPDIWLVFAPVKNEKIDYTVRRAVELGAAVLQPVMTRHTIVSRVNMERLQANAIEAAESCGRMDVPELREPLALDKLLGAWPADRTLLFCDESGNGENLRTLLPSLKPEKLAILIGPEGGFVREEQEVLKKQKFVRGMSLGPRILRAETAALAALANVMAWAGDWDEKPSFEERDASCSR